MDKKIENFTWTWDEGRYWDLWMISHIMSGLLFGFVGYFVGLTLVITVIISLVVMILWEVFEKVVKINEVWINSILDVVFGILAVFISYFLAGGVSSDTVLYLIIALVIVKSVYGYLGWNAFKKRKKKETIDL